MDQETIGKITKEAVGEICTLLNDIQSPTQDDYSEIATDLSERLKKLTGIDFEIMVYYDENQPNQLTVGIAHDVSVKLYILRVHDS